MFLYSSKPQGVVWCWGSLGLFWSRPRERTMQWPRWYNKQNGRRSCTMSEECHSRRPWLF
jgi:hypothetical protein